MLETAMLCLALNVYHEARGEPDAGQWAVAQVTMNRAQRDPKKVCDAVFAPRQFSWANPLTEAPTVSTRKKRAKHFMPRDPVAWDKAKTIAQRALIGLGEDVVGDATHYHATRVAPRWASSLEEVAQVGDHIFYR